MKMITTMATSTSSVSIIPLRAQPSREINHHSYSKLYFDKDRKRPINRKSSARQSFTTIEASSSLSTSSAAAKKTEPMVPPYNVLITGSTKGQFSFLAALRRFWRILSFELCLEDLFIFRKPRK